VEAAAFLVKPVNKARLHRVLDRLARKLEPDAMLTLSLNVKIPAGLVLYAAAADHCLKVHASNRDYFPDLSMEEFRSRLPDQSARWKLFVPLPGFSS